MVLRQFDAATVVGASVVGRGLYVGRSVGFVVDLEQCRRSTLLRSLRAHIQQLTQSRHHARVSLQRRRPRTKQ